MTAEQHIKPETAVEKVEQTDKPKGTVPAPRTPRELMNLLWTGWPFAEGTWAWPEMVAATAPFRVEELLQDGQVVVRAELPGIDPRNIEVTVEDGVLSIRAEREEKHEDRTATGYRSEFRYGSFERHVRLPRGTTAEVVSATYRDGVLEIRMPAPSPRGAVHRIEVERG